MKKLYRIACASIIATACASAFAQAADKQAAVDRALALIQANPSIFQLAPSRVARTAKALDINATSSADTISGAATDQFKVRDVIVDQNGAEHVRFDRFYGGLPVIGADVVVHSKQGQLQQPSTTLNAPINLANLVPSQKALSSTSDIGAAAAEKIAAAQFATRVDHTGSPVKVIYARNTAPVLAYQVDVYGPSTRDHSSVMRYSIDARTGRVLETESLIQQSAATGIGRSYYYGDVTLTTDQTSANGYRMLDPKRGNGSVHDGADLQDYVVVSQADSLPIYTSTTNTWGTYNTSNRQTVAADIDYGLAITWDYYKNTHGRSGVANDGNGVRSYAHVLFGDDGANASWYSGVMLYGDGGPSLGNQPVVTLDVAGHEMTHGVTQNTARLSYNYRDSGGLNESTSDIFGTLVKFYANNPNDPGNYVIGASLMPGGLRKMYKQDLDNRSSSCYPSGGFTNTNPHLSSGVGNRFFYLLAEGATVPSTDPSLSKSQLVCNGDTSLTGIGRDKAGKIWYRTLSVYLTSGSTYPNARAASIRAASDLYGAASIEAQTVAKAWDAVNVR
ncbi:MULTISPECIES: M4 family metallopeptidase [Burkholderia]|uniref:M4 family metallopeptidase n=1 Tax=Burkholderia TaxID=32008 RepID=UPI0008413B0F|nr:MULTISPECIES: M4 family metallopeptidase [unclassified Burkholderia]AOK32575.1 peptidase M4 [Burkholderia sp. Bp7605]